MSERWDELFRDALSEREQAGQLRNRRAVRVIDSTHLEHDGRRFISFASNDYLGLTHHPSMIEAVTRSARESGVGSGAAPLISGYTDAHQRAEQRIAQWKGTQSAVLLPSGYQANHAAVQTLAAAGNVRFLLDKLVHASLIDAVRGTEKEMRVFPHNQLEKLDRLLTDAPKDQLQIVVTESIFSMDGDAADLRGIAQLKAKHNFLLLLDEAHGSGVYGEHGSGYANELGLKDVADVTVVTLSKALGCVGGAVCGSELFIRALVNFGRAWIYSTNVPAMVADAAAAALDVMRDEPQRQQRVRDLAKRVRDGIRGMGLESPAGDSPIISVILGSEQAALDAAATMRECGMWIVAVRPPTIPAGKSRIRITLSSDHTDADIETLLRALGELR